MTVTRNAVANYFGKIYQVSSGIVVLPLFMQLVGEEAYGLIGFFTLAHAWMQFFNFGLSPTLGREAAKSKASSDGLSVFYRVLTSYELIFFCFSICIAIVALWSSQWLASTWLNASSIEPDKLHLALCFLILAVVPRFQSGLYKSGLMGYELQVYLNSVEVFIVSLRYVAPLFILAFISNDIVVFFVYQTVISFLELLLLRRKLFLQFAGLKRKRYAFYVQDVRRTLPFASGIAYTAGLWVLATQIDKAIMSGLLDLREFGYYSMVVLVAGGVVQLIQPVSAAISPRLTYLIERDETERFYELYLVATKVISIVALSASFLIFFNAGPLIYMWTGSEQASTWGTNILMWFVLGWGVLALSSYQYLLQFAHGSLKLHVSGASLSALIQIPAAIYCAFNFGAFGVAVAWFTIRALFFLVWVPFVHSKFKKGLHKEWLMNGVLPAFIVALGVSWFLSLFSPYFESSRLVILIWIILQATIILTSCIFAYPKLRKQLALEWARLRKD